MRTIRLRILFIIWCFTNQMLSAQSSFGDYVQKAMSDPSVVEPERQLAYLASNPFRVGPVQKIELRTESNQLEPERQDYAVRISPANPWRVRNQNSYFRELTFKIELERSLALKKVLEDRYATVVKIIMLTSLEQLAKQELELVQLQLKIQEKQQFSDAFNAEAYAELAFEELEKKESLDEVSRGRERLKRSILAEMNSLEEGGIDLWKEDELVSCDQIFQLLQNPKGPSVTTTALYHQSKINVAERSYALEKSSINLGYIQTQYQHFRIEQDRRPWSIALGVTIPIVNPNRGDMAKEKLAIMEAELELRKQVVEESKEQEGTMADLQILLRRYAWQQEKNNALHCAKIASALTALDDNNPMASLRFQHHLINQHVQEVKLHQEILLTYIKWLASIDALQQLPLTNYLSKYMETL